jgi:hypothetical protein
MLMARSRYTSWVLLRRAQQKRPAPLLTSSTSCPVGDTVCSGGCCPNEFPGEGTCCADGVTCCAHGYRCALSSHQCVALNATAHPLAKTTNLYRLCQGPTRLEFLTNVVGSSKRFPYYSSRRPLGARDTGLVMAAIVVHGAGRNADDYFCSMSASSHLQSSYPLDSVGVLAPRFWEPQDDPASGSLYWPGADPNGVWRFGSAAQNANNISSFDVLDAMLRVLLDRTLYRLRVISVLIRSLDWLRITFLILNQRTHALEQVPSAGAGHSGWAQQWWPGRAAVRADYKDGGRSAGAVCGRQPIQLRVPQRRALAGPGQTH